MLVLDGMGLASKQQVAHAPFPLTPTLSLGEREQHLPPWLHVCEPGCANKRSRMVHPLPKGEGRGEGEGKVKISIDVVHGKSNPRGRSAIRSSGKRSKSELRPALLWEGSNSLISAIRNKDSSIRLELYLKPAPASHHFLLHE